MRNWMRDRMKRGKKKSDPKAGGGTGASEPPPLQPKYPDMPEAPRFEPQPEAAPIESESQPETAGTGSSVEGARPRPKGQRRRRRGGRARGARPQRRPQPTTAAPEPGEPRSIQEPAFSETDPGPVLAETRAPEHRPSEFDRQATV